VNTYSVALPSFDCTLRQGRKSPPRLPHIFSVVLNYVSRRLKVPYVYQFHHPGIPGDTLKVQALHINKK